MAISIDVPHSLGREEAKRRMNAGVGKLADRIPGGNAEVSATWPSENRMAMVITAMGQKISADLDVEDALVRVKLVVPLMLSMMSGPITALVKKSAEDLLLTDASGKKG